MAALTLIRRADPLSRAAEQLRILNQLNDQPTFEEMLTRHNGPPLVADALEILQVNMGKVCNQTCQHCHVDAGPDRKEQMSRETLEHCLSVLDSTDVRLVDITGGAPEMNPHFRWFVEEVTKRGRQVIDRCNLTILLAPGFTDLPEFLARHRVEIVASLPCYLAENTDRQRGDGVHLRSIEAIRKLNTLGYGTGSLPLTLVYNPVGPSLPPDQATLEADYKRELASRYGVFFDRLFVITNMPISRFLEDLLTTGRYETYMHKLISAFNPSTVSGLMCRNTLSVGWDGQLYDCDFNQMLEIGVAEGTSQTIAEFRRQSLLGRSIRTGRHCFGCTAGSGSSCQGALG